MYSNQYVIILSYRAVVVVKWSACLPYTPTIQVRITQTCTVFSVNLCVKRTKINTKKPGQAHFFINIKLQHNLTGFKLTTF